jgi:hypothetical protein
VRSGPGAARTILLFHTIRDRPSKHPRMVGSTLGVYSFGLIFVSARTNKRHHHHMEPVAPQLYPIHKRGLSIVNAVMASGPIILQLDACNFCIISTDPTLVTRDL